MRGFWKGVLALGAGFIFSLAPGAGTEAVASSSFFTSQCGSCHSGTGVSSTCNGCHAHGTHASSNKSGINLTGATNKATYAPGETVTVSIKGGYRTGWARFVLYNESGVEVARSVGNASGMGYAVSYNATTIPATLSAAAPANPGTYTWKFSWYGNRNDTGGATFGAGWKVDPNNADHGEEVISTNSFTVVAAADTTAPTVSAFTLPGTSNSLTISVNSFTATDDTAVTGYLVTTSSTPPAAGAGGWTSSAPTTVTAPGAGSTTFYAWAKDAAGNVSGSRSATVNVTLPDAIAPTVTAFTLPVGSNSLTIAVTSFTASDDTAVTGYLVTTSSSAPSAGAGGWSGSAPTTVTAPNVGSITFYAWAKDAAGNVSSSATATVTVTLPPADTTPPAISVFTLPATSETASIPVTALDATDDVGVTGYLITQDSSAPSAGAGGWSQAKPATVTVPGSGSFTFYAWAKDAAGNVSDTASATVVVTIASTNPQLAVSTLSNGAYTNERMLNVSGTVTDADGIRGLLVNGKAATLAEDGSFTKAVKLKKGSNTITVKATDNGGNVTTDVRTVIYDPKAPSLAITAPADNLKTGTSFVTLTGKTNEESTVTVTVNGGDPSSADLDGTSFSATVNLVEGVNTIEVTATDLAGNTTTKKRTVVYDHTNPVLEITDPAEDLTTPSRRVTLRGTVSDDLKVTVKVTVNGKSASIGVNKGKFRKNLTFSKPGTYLITVTAKDFVGNSSTVTREIVYDPQAARDDD